MVNCSKSITAKLVSFEVLEQSQAFGRGSSLSVAFCVGSSVLGVVDVNDKRGLCG